LEGLFFASRYAPKASNSSARSTRRGRSHFSPTPQPCCFRSIDRNRRPGDDRGDGVRDARSRRSPGLRAVGRRRLLKGEVEKQKRSSPRITSACSKDQKEMKALYARLSVLDANLAKQSLRSLFDTIPFSKNESQPENGPRAILMFGLEKAASVVSLWQGRHAHDHAAGLIGGFRIILVTDALCSSADESRACSSKGRTGGRRHAGFFGGSLSRHHHHQPVRVPRVGFFQKRDCPVCSPVCTSY
jgi:hypothetical protein